MKSFLSRFMRLDRLCPHRLRSLAPRRRICAAHHASGVHSYCHQQRLLFKDFPAHAQALTEQWRDGTTAQLGDVPLLYLDSPAIDKEAAALGLAARTVRSTPRGANLPGSRADLSRPPQRPGLIQLRKENTRCLHYYHYYRHERFGLCYVRIQSWFPFSIRVGLNGRHWLARQLQSRGVPFQQRGNLLTAVDDPALAQSLLDEQLHVDWPGLLRDWLRPIHPLWDYLHDAPIRTPYYWMAEQTEWATDFLFHSPAAGPLVSVLAPARPGHHGLQGRAWLPRQESARPRLRRLRRRGQDRPAHACRGDPSEVLVRHQLAQDLRQARRGVAGRSHHQPAEGLQVFRTKQGEDEHAPPSWQHLRKGVADLPRRARLSQAANNRLAERLASVAEPTTVGKLLEPLGRPVRDGGRRRARPLSPFGADKGTALLGVLARGDFALNGFRNRDLRTALYGAGGDAVQRRRHSAAITRRRPCPTA